MWQWSPCKPCCSEEAPTSPNCCELCGIAFGSIAQLIVQLSGFSGQCEIANEGTSATNIHAPLQNSQPLGHGRSLVPYAGSSGGWIGTWANQWILWRYNAVLIYPEGFPVASIVWPTGVFQIEIYQRHSNESTECADAEQELCLLIVRSFEIVGCPECNEHGYKLMTASSNGQQIWWAATGTDVIPSSFSEGEVRECCYVYDGEAWVLADCEEQTGSTLPTCGCGSVNFVRNVTQMCNLCMPLGATPEEDRYRVTFGAWFGEVYNPEEEHPLTQYCGLPHNATFDLDYLGSSCNGGTWVYNQDLGEGTFEAFSVRLNITNSWTFQQYANSDHRDIILQPFYCEGFGANDICCERCTIHVSWRCNAYSVGGANQTYSFALNPDTEEWEYIGMRKSAGFAGVPYNFVPQCCEVASFMFGFGILGTPIGTPVTVEKI